MNRAAWSRCGRTLPLNSPARVITGTTEIPRPTGWSNRNGGGSGNNSAASKTTKDPRDPLAAEVTPLRLVNGEIAPPEAPGLPGGVLRYLEDRFRRARRPLSRNNALLRTTPKTKVTLPQFLQWLYDLKLLSAKDTTVDLAVNELQQRGWWSRWSHPWKKGYGTGEPEYLELHDCFRWAAWAMLRNEKFLRACQKEADERTSSTSSGSGPLEGSGSSLPFHVADGAPPVVLGSGRRRSSSGRRSSSTTGKNTTNSSTRSSGDDRVLRARESSKGKDMRSSAKSSHRPSELPLRAKGSGTVGIRSPRDIISLEARDSTPKGKRNGNTQAAVKFESNGIESPKKSGRNPSVAKTKTGKQKRNSISVAPDR